MNEPESKIDEISSPNSSSTSPSIRSRYSSTTTTITDTLSGTMEDLDSLIARRKAELAERLKKGDKTRTLK